MKEEYYNIMTNIFRVIGLLTAMVGLLTAREWAVGEMTSMMSVTFVAMMSIALGALLYGVGEIINLLKVRESYNKKNGLSGKNKVIELKRNRL